MRFLAVLAATAGLLAAPVLSSAISYNNPIVNQRADPHISKQTDGWYYFTATVPDYDKIVLRRAKTIQDLGTASETTIWRRKASGRGSGQVWAPELHHIDGKWYIYVALGVSGQWNIRAFVLEGTGDNPLTATWVEKGVVKTNWDTFSLDMTTFAVNGTRYLVWAQQVNGADENSSLMIAPTQNPWTIRGTAIAISRPTLSWEKIGYKVNEGPAVIQRNGKIFISYSAAATDYNYCIGLLTASANSDLMNVASWSKSQTPIFVSNSDTQQFGPGHNTFTVSEDGQSDILVYHDRSYRDIKGDPLNDPNRRTRVQKLYWKADGTPDFGFPVADGLTPVRLRSTSSQNLYLRYRTSNQGSNTAPTLAETLFRIVPGLAGNGTVSLESASKPGTFLRRSGSQLRFEARGTGSFVTDASFFQRQGLADPAAVSFEGSSGSYVLLGTDSSLSMSSISNSEQKGLSTFLLD
ncbi:glycosyl hydrolase [Echria macrotheca]|uniref:non-reducing end alpha-L-arabinofuranosidase n=1 Tax=Echria macrotheca TaxID=438768 RepID=A0AAJ0B4S9_9PEZI|nr:glycosyl hydrolase [Echria macrotheca]